MAVRKLLWLATAVTLVTVIVTAWLADDRQTPPPVPIIIPRPSITTTQKRQRHTNRGTQSDRVEVYMTNTEFLRLKEEGFLEATPWEQWPAWVFTVLNNYAYSSKFGYRFSLWVPPPTEVCGYWTRGWGNVLVGQYLSERVTEGSYAKPDWLMYLDSDAFFNEPDVSLGYFLSTTSLKRSKQSHEEGGRLPFGVSRPLLDFDYINSLVNTSLIASSEHPIESVWELVDEWGYLNSGVFLLNMRNRDTASLVSEWSQSVVKGTCHKRFRTTRIAEQSCLDSLMFRNQTTSDKYKHLLGIAEFGSLNSPAGRFIRHPWDVKELNELSWMTYGWPLMTMAGIQTQKEAITLAHKLLNTTLIRQLPMRFGDNSPGWEGTLKWPSLGKDVIAAFVEISQSFTEWPSMQAEHTVSEFDEMFAADTSEACLVIVTTASPHCLLVTWVATDGRCYCSADTIQTTSLTNSRDVLTWVSTSVSVTT